VTPGALERRVERVLADYIRGLGVPVDGGPGADFMPERDPFVELWTAPAMHDQDGLPEPVEIVLSDLAKHLIRELNL